MFYQFRVDYLSSVSDVTKLLFEKAEYCSDLNIPERLILYDENKKNPCSNEPLSKFQNLNRDFYYSVVSPVDYLKCIANQQKSAIKELESLLEEKEKIISGLKNNIMLLEILDIDEVKKLKTIKQIGNNPSGELFEVCKTDIIKQNYVLKESKMATIKMHKSY